MGKKLLDYAEKQAQGMPLRLEDLDGKEVTITGLTWSKGNFGAYGLIECVCAGGEVKVVMTSAILVLDALKHVEDAKAFPVTATFTKRGRSWIVA